MQRLKTAFLSTLCFLIVGLNVSCGQGAGPGEPARAGGHSYVAVPPGTHPGIFFSKRELPALRARTTAEGLPAESWQKIVRLAQSDSTVRFEGAWESHRLRALALVYQVSGRKEDARAAIDAFMQVLRETDPVEYYRKVNEDFFETENWPLAFACAWDWLYEAMTDEERVEALPKLELWCKALYDHTESWWWRDASYNCGAIPVGALGLLCTAIRGEATHPDFDKWFQSCIQRIRDNYFTTAWRANGICYEGPCYAQYTRNALEFGEALRRNSGEDIVHQSGAINAMHYQVFQWLPQGGCAPVGDNTEYGRRVFVGSYMLGIGEMQDSAALWTFEKYTDRKRLDPLMTFLWWPDSLAAVSPGQSGWPTSCYFEIAPFRAGYIFSRSEWDNEKAHFFAFVTRFTGANHQHYDHNTFLFDAFGDEFGTHRNIYSYSDPDHGADKEHNIVIVDGGGWPAHDRSSAGDDCSTGGLMVGLGLGHFADYARGDARNSYHDNSVPGSCPALRADRAVLFVKQGPAPYLLVTDDIQQSTGRHDYDWQWFCPDSTLSGAGTVTDPVLLHGRNADCSITLIEPARPALSFNWVVSPGRRRSNDLGLVKVRQSGSRVRYVALAAAWAKGAPQPRVSPGPGVTGNPRAVSLVVEGEGFRDLLVWQPEDSLDAPAPSVTCGGMSLQGYLGMVRVNADGSVGGYVLGEGGALAWNGMDLVRSGRTASVSADSHEIWVSGKMESRQGDAPIPGEATVRALADRTALYLDSQPVSGEPGAEGYLHVGVKTVH